MPHLDTNGRGDHDSDESTPRAMRRFLPGKFGRREWLLSSLAVVMAIASGWLTWAAGMGAGGALLLCVVVGTAFFVAVAGSDRCFFTALFTGLMVVGLLAAMIVHLVFVQQESLNREHAVMFPLTFGSFVVLPSAFAWLVTLIVRRASP